MKSKSRKINPNREYMEETIYEMKRGRDSIDKFHSQLASIGESGNLLINILLQDAEHKMLQVIHLAERFLDGKSSLRKPK